MISRAYWKIVHLGTEKTPGSYLGGIGIWAAWTTHQGFHYPNVVISDETEMETLLDGRGRARIWQKLVLICLIEHKSKMVNDFIHDADNEAIHVESIYWVLADMMPGIW